MGHHDTKRRVDRLWQSFFSWGFCAVLIGACGLGCSQFRPSAVLESPAASSTVRANDEPVPRAKVLPPEDSEPTHLPPPKKVLPITLDTVFRLAQDQNNQILLAREKLNEAFAGRELAQKAWLPQVHLGAGYYRLEGGVQEPAGDLLRTSLGAAFAGLNLQSELDLRDVVFQRIDAERQIWQQRGEVSRLTSETLLDAANTYVDLLAAATGEAISLDLEEKLQKTLQLAEKLAAIDPGAKVEVERVQSQLLAQQSMTWRFRKGVRASSAKLVYLLKLDPCAALVPADPELVPLRLLDAHLCASDLISKALAQGPGIYEMEGLIALVTQSQERAQGMGQFIPVLETRTLAGGFGAGRGSTLDWTNRWEMSLQARWNITNLATAKERDLMTRSKVQQLHLGYDELRGKLVLGVREAFEESISSAEQIEIGKKQIESALAAYQLSEQRLVQRIKDSSPSEVLLALQGVAAARLEYLNALRNFDKAQLRLLILTGTGKTGHH